MRFEWLSNLMFLYYCGSSTNISGNDERVFSVISSSIMTWLHNLSCDIINELLCVMHSPIIIGKKQVLENPTLINGSNHDGL